MRAFLSHSSKDKAIVRAVAELLGNVSCEYDEYTFEYTLNSQAIRSALRRTDLFVFFLSENSIQSDFVAEELRQAQELTAKGGVSRAIVICLDGTSYNALPEWLREVNVSHYLNNTKHCARRIQALLTELSLQDENFEKFYLGREDDHKIFRKNLTRPAGEKPRILHTVGLHGVGRRTFLKRALKENLPRVCEIFLEISVAKFDGVDELYRKIAQLHFPGGALALSEEFSRFAELDLTEKLDRCWDIIIEMNERGEFLIFIDDGGALNEEGAYNPFFDNLHRRSRETNRVVCGIVQSRLMPFRTQKNFPRSYVHRLSSLSDEDVFDLFSLKLQDMEIPHTGAQISELRELCDGHPYNIDFIVGYVAQYGIETTLSDPSDIVAWRAKRGLEFLRGLDFNEIELSVMRVIREYEYCNLEFIGVALNTEPANFSSAIRRLEEFCCLDRRGVFYVISPPIREAMRHDKRFQGHTEWYKEIASRVLSTVKEYRPDESVSINLVTEAIVPALKEKADIPFLAKFILPSHFLMIARDYYNKGDWREAIEFCDRALARKLQLTQDASIECLRINGLAQVRLNAFTPKIVPIVGQLRATKTNSAKRIAYFIEGFAARKQKKYVLAEEKFRKAFEFQESNIHVNRELAALLCRCNRPSEAEPYARRALRLVPDNPFIVDVLIDCLEGKQAKGERVDRRELLSLREHLSLICEGTDLHFERIRQAREKFDRKDFQGAISILSDVVRTDPKNGAARFYRAKCSIRVGDKRTAESDLVALQNLSDLESGMETFADEVEIELMMDAGDYHGARNKISNLTSSSPDVGRDIERRLKSLILQEHSRSGPELISWART